MIFILKNATKSVLIQSSIYLFSVLILLISMYTENNPDLLEPIGQICGIYSYIFYIVFTLYLHCI